MSQSLADTSSSIESKASSRSIVFPTQRGGFAQGGLPDLASGGPPNGVTRPASLGMDLRYSTSAQRCSSVNLGPMIPLTGIVFAGHAQIGSLVAEGAILVGKAGGATRKRWFRYAQEPRHFVVTVPEYRIFDAASARQAAVRYRRQVFLVDARSLDPDTAERTGKELTALAQECGCDSGAVGLLLAVLACALVAFFFWSAALAHPIIFSVAMALFCFLAAGLGKGVSLLVARRELRSRLLSLATQLELTETTLFGMR
jgi:hypothetical protein